MPRKKKEENEEVLDAATETAEAVEASEEQAVEAAPEAETVAVEEVSADAVPEAEAAPVEEKPKKAAKASKSEAPAEEPAKPAAKQSKRAERIGVVSSDKMTKTVVVRVDRLIKHPIYRKYVKRRKNLMAHDEIGAGVGDKVRIVETRPLSARKRWRVVEIIQKAEK